MTIRLFVLLPILFFLFACSGSDQEKMTYASASQAESEQRNKSKYLAYEHSITVEVKESTLQLKYDTFLSKCSKDTETNCTMLDSSLSIGEHFGQANIRIRINPEGVDTFSQLAVESGKITNQSTKVDDLAKDVIDTNKRIEMLTSHRDKLLELEESKSTDVDSLLKIAKELTSVQSQLEYSAGKELYLKQRINRDVLNIFFQTKRDRSFLKPIVTAAGDFGYELASGISEAISIFAYVIPNFIIFIILLIVTIKIWKRVK